MTAPKPKPDHLWPHGFLDVEAQSKERGPAICDACFQQLGQPVVIVTKLDKQRWILHPSCAEHVSRMLQDAASEWR